MAVSSVGNSVSLADATTKTAAAATTSSVALTTFLKLMITELKNQDPSSPMSSESMVNQMAQMNSVQAMDNMSVALDTIQLQYQISSATNMMGKTVAYTDADGKKTSGLVGSVAIDGTKVTLTVGSESVALSSVTEVS